MLREESYSSHTLFIKLTLCINRKVVSFRFTIDIHTDGKYIYLHGMCNGHMDMDLSKLLHISCVVYKEFVLRIIIRIILEIHLRLGKYIRETKFLKFKNNQRKL